MKYSQGEKFLDNVIIVISSIINLNVEKFVSVSSNRVLMENMRWKV